MNRFMAPGPGTAAIFLGGGVPKDFIQITATSVSTLRGAEACPHVAAIQITTDNPVYGGLGGAGVNSEAISWGKEAVDGDNVMVFADVTIALPLLCQGLLERYGPDHVRPGPRGDRPRAGARAGRLIDRRDTLTAPSRSPGGLAARRVNASIETVVSPVVAL